MKINIRKEEREDFEAVFNLIQQAFEQEEFTDHQEQFLVERLRNSEAFVPELSLVAETDGKIAGYVLLTKLKIIADDLKETESLALAPVAVLPEYQGKGVGGKLIRTAHQKASELGFHSIILLGHSDYYPRFGYEMTKKFGIKLPFDVPDENCMVIELSENALQHVSGTVHYPKEFEG
ncbi:GNAT family N-acetyltransferase [Fluviicola sp.]|uniref:GNAT family N-acetyltransferase n=1 Tax=Fluviicola sp. TaxID=1917219 RepID=UPI00260EBDB9|nr:N-acetyltransferase [Fluviicola sp.]